MDGKDVFQLLVWIGFVVYSIYRALQQQRERQRQQERSASRRQPQRPIPAFQPRSSTRSTGERDDDLDDDDEVMAGQLWDDEADADRLVRGDQAVGDSYDDSWATEAWYGEDEDALASPETAAAELASHRALLAVLEQTARPVTPPTVFVEGLGLVSPAASQPTVEQVSSAALQPHPSACEAESLHTTFVLATVLGPPRALSPGGFHAGRRGPWGISHPAGRLAGPRVGR